MSRPLSVVDLGRRPYDEVWQLQKRLVEERAEDRIPDMLLLVEHDPVITLGRGADREDHVREAGETPVLDIERGGEATYHAPGQVVGYPIFKLEGANRDLHRLLRNLEEVQIRALARWGLSAGRKQGLTGVWVGERKIASIGIAVRRWVSYHGFALNVTTDLAGFRSIRACGMEPDVMTSMAALLRQDLSLGAVKQEIVRQFQAVFDYDLVANERSWVQED